MSVSLSGLAWKSQDLAQNPTHIIEASDCSVDKLAVDLPDGEDLTEEFLSLSSGERELTYLKADLAALFTRIAADVAERLNEGPGFAILTGAELPDLTDCQLRNLIFGTSLALGSPMAQNPAGDLLVSVRDEAPSDPQARGYRTNAGLPMHTDAADVAGLLCLKPGSSGGISTFASAQTVHDTLCDEIPHLVHEYYHRWHWDRRGLEPPGASPTLRSAVFSYYQGHLSCRYAPKLLREGPARAGVELTGGQAAALDRFDEVAARPELAFAYSMSRGESIWLNNYAVLHGRSAFSDAGPAGSERHLLRTWIWAHQARPLAPVFVSPKEVY